MVLIHKCCSDNTKQLCDLIASEGYKVVMPDFLFKGQKPFNVLGLPREEMIAWVMKHGSIDAVCLLHQSIWNGDTTYDVM